MTNDHALPPKTDDHALAFMRELSDLTRRYGLAIVKAEGRLVEVCECPAGNGYQGFFREPAGDGRWIFSAPWG